MLGNCEKCQGQLCVSGRQVTCERCGHVHADHPATKPPKNARSPRPAPDIPPQHYAASLMDRLNAAERRLAAFEHLEHRVAELERRVAELTAPSALGHVVAPAPGEGDTAPPVATPPAITALATAGGKRGK